MSIKFARQDSELILILASDGIDIQAILDVLDKGEDWRVSRSFTVNKTHLSDDLPQRVGNIIEALSQEISAKQ